MQGLGGRAGFEQAEEPLASGLAQSAQLGQDGSVDADETMSLLPLVEGGDVGKADDGLAQGGWGRLGLRRACRFQSLQKPHSSIAAAGTEDGTYGWIGESAIQLREPARIVARQVSVAPENSRVVLNAIAGGNNGEPGVE
jgi:hypothetical protein